jgi:hypothetical protein
LTAKAAIDSSNIIIETKSKTITVFFQIVENASVGGFNGQVRVSSKIEEN